MRLTMSSKNKHKLRPRFSVELAVNKWGTLTDVSINCILVL